MSFETLQILKKDTVVNWNFIKWAINAIVILYILYYIILLLLFTSTLMLGLIYLLAAAEQDYMFF